MRLCILSQKRKITVILDQYMHISLFYLMLLKEDKMDVPVNKFKKNER